MKKIVIAVLAVLGIILCGCDVAGDGGDKDSITKDYEPINISLPEEYRVSFKITATDGKPDSSALTLIKDSNGFAILSSANEESTGSVFIKNKAGEYDYYIGSADNYHLVDGISLSFEEIEPYLKQGTALLDLYSAYADASELESCGEEVICGRVCNCYRPQSFELDGSAGNIICSIDRETGMCMKFTSNLNYGLNAGEGLSYECVEFVTTGISLPLLA